MRDKEQQSGRWDTVSPKKAAGSVCWLGVRAEMFWEEEGVMVDSQEGTEEDPAVI